MTDQQDNFLTSSDWSGQSDNSISVNIRVSPKEKDLLQEPKYLNS